MSQAIGFIDVGYLKAEGVRTLNLRFGDSSVEASGCVAVLRDLAGKEGSTLLRAYWYDGAFEPSDPRYVGQRKYLDAIASCPGIQLRLGHLSTHTPKWHVPLQAALAACNVDMAEFNKHFTFKDEVGQKGVDSLMVLDLVRLAQRRAYDTAFLIAGDRDLAEAVRVAQDEGRRVVLLRPQQDGGVAAELRHLADAVYQFTTGELQSMIHTRSRPQP